MTSLAEARVLFVAAAGLRRGLSSLVEYLVVARVHGMRPLVAVPGSAREAEMVVALGADVIARATPKQLEAMRPDVVVVDDPVAAQNGSWIIAAQRVGALILTVNDLGIESRPASRTAARRQVPAFQSARRSNQAQGARR